MWPASSSFARALRRLDDDALAAFVAAAWAARGWETTRAGSLVVAYSPNGLGERRIRVADAPTPDDHEVVVRRPGAVPIPPAADVRVVGPADLHEFLKYALDRGDADRLCRAHLGRPLLVDSASPVRSVSRPAVLAAVLVVVVAAAAGAVLLDAGQGGSTVDATTTPPGATTTLYGGQQFPPGVSDGGVVDLAALASASDATFVGVPYDRTLVVRRGWTLDGRQWDVLRSTATVAADGGYALEDRGYSAGGDHVVVDGYARDGVLYVRNGTAANGSVYHVANARTASLVGRPGRGPAAYVRRYLATGNTTARYHSLDGAPAVRVVATGPPTNGSVLGVPADVPTVPPIANYTAVAEFTPEGRLRSLSVRFVAGGRQVRVNLTYSHVGTASLLEPTWLPAALNATGGTCSDLPPPNRAGPSPYCPNATTSTAVAPGGSPANRPTSTGESSTTTQAGS